jgi:hypothetical protein
MKLTLIERHVLVVKKTTLPFIAIFGKAIITWWFKAHSNGRDEDHYVFNSIHGY